MQETQGTKETWVRSLGQKDPLEEEMATHSSILAWKIPWAEDPGGLQSMESQSRTKNSLEASLQLTCILYNVLNVIDGTCSKGKVVSQIRFCNRKINWQASEIQIKSEA